MKTAKQMRAEADARNNRLPVLTLEQIAEAMERSVRDGYYFVTEADFRGSPVRLNSTIATTLRELGYEVSGVGRTVWQIRCDGESQ